MKKNSVLVSICVAFLILTSSVLAEQRHVPSEYPTIQDAIEAANNGDTVIVAKGTYTGPGNRDIDFLGKAITVQSLDPCDPDIVNATVIDCEGSNANSHRGFKFYSGEGLDSVVAGLTIINGYGLDEKVTYYDVLPAGGAIFCDSSSPTIIQCNIRNCQAYFGGGIYCDNSSPVISLCNIVENSSDSDQGGRGGGIMCQYQSNPKISFCRIKGNTVGDSGGGIYFGYGSPKVTNCIITNNKAINFYGGGYGGGIFCSGSYGSISHCTIANNVAGFYGGGIEGLWANTSVSNSIVWGNTCQYGKDIRGISTVSYSNIGGGYTGQGNIDADPCFADPHACDYHLTFFSPCLNAGDPNYICDPCETDQDGDPRIINGRTDIGADEVNVEGPLIDIQTTIFEFHAIEHGYNPEPQVLNIRNNGLDLLIWDVLEECSWIEVNPVSGVSQDQVNDIILIVDISGLGSGIYNCELTVTAAGAINSPRVVEVSLVVHAPVIELSTNSFEFLALEDGPNPNVQELDIRNADVETLHWSIENNCDWLEVNPQEGFSTGENNKVTLSVDIQGMGPGTYSCEFEVISDWAANSPQVVSVSLYIGVALQVPSEYLTIQTAINAAEKGDTVLIADGIYTGTGNRDIDFKGKAITVRSENGPENCVIDCQRLGRGFYFHSGEDTASVLDGLTITNGYSDFDGGGICCWNNSNPTIINCDIIGNIAFFNGGGIAGYKSKPAISNCFISCNSTVHFGGGLSRLEGPISNCIITGNKAGPEGGGLYWYNGDITNCVITGNTASFGAGLIWCKGNISGCTISGNKSEGDSGGLESCHGLISNCIIWGNIAERNAQIFNCTEPTYSCVQDWPYPENGNIDEDPLFAAPSLAWMYWELVPFCHWKFDEGEGDTAYDSAGNYHGHIIEAQWVQGQIGDALRFNGEFGHVLVNDEWILGFNQYESFSISAWIKCNKDSSDIINKGFMDGTAYDGGYDFGIYQSKLRLAINDYDNTFTSVSGITDVTDDQWHYVVAVRDITEKRLHLYVDGSPDAMPVSDTTTTLIGSGARVLIGEHFGGIIDELTIHKTAFTIEQIQQFYEVGLSGHRLENEPNYGDYHLLSDSPCIDTGDPNYEPEPNETDLDGNPRVIGGRIDMGAYEFMPPIEVPMKFTPKALNLSSGGKLVKAHFVLPEGFTVEDVDANTPAVIVPYGIESYNLTVLLNDEGLVRVEATFKRSDLCSSITSYDDNIEVMVIGRLTSGQYFYGTDIIKVTDRAFEHLATIVSHWLEADCIEPDWCGGADLNRDSVVNFKDFALLDRCCIEVTEE